MSYLDLFQRYGNPSREADIRLHAYLTRPDTLTADRIQYNDDTAARLIEDCRRTIADLTEYRQALAARYAELQKQRPGIETHQDTDRRPWER